MVSKSKQSRERWWRLNSNLNESYKSDESSHAEQSNGRPQDRRVQGWMYYHMENHPWAVWQRQESQCQSQQKRRHSSNKGNRSTGRMERTTAIARQCNYCWSPLEWWWYNCWHCPWLLCKNIQQSHVTQPIDHPCHCTLTQGRNRHIFLRGQINFSWFFPVENSHFGWPKTNFSFCLFFPIRQQKFPGQKSLGALSPPRLLRHCPYLRRGTLVRWPTTVEYPSCQAVRRCTTRSYSAESETMWTRSWGKKIRLDFDQVEVAPSRSTSSEEWWKAFKITNYH